MFSQPIKTTKTRGNLIPAKGENNRKQQEKYAVNKTNKNIIKKEAAEEEKEKRESFHRSS